MRPPHLHPLGGSLQLLLEDAGDLRHLEQLDEALWAASAAPIEAFCCDPVFLRLLDTDGNDRIRIDELKAAARWMLRMLVDRTDVGASEAGLRLAAIDTTHAEGQRLHTTAAQLLENLDRAGDPELTLAQVRDRQRIMAAAATNGDGVIPASALEAPALRALVTDIAATVGTTSDASGADGVTEAHLAAFLKAARARLAWRASGDSTRWLGAQTEPAWAAWDALQEPLDRFFALCHLLRFGCEDALELPKAGDPRERLKEVPFAVPTPEGRLDGATWVNPVHAPAWERLVALALDDDPALDEAGWRALCDRFGPHARWRDTEAGAQVSRLPDARLREILAATSEVDALRALMLQDREVGDELLEIGQVERLILYQRWLFAFANNFVNFSEFHDPSRRSLIEMGALILDGRRFGLSVRVRDRVSHKTRAKASRIFLLYVECLRSQPPERMELAVAVTSRRRGHLQIGQWGIFEGADGRIWDARVVDVLENPVSLMEAVTQPFVRLTDFLSAQTERFVAARTAQVEAALGSEIAASEKQLSAIPPAPVEAPEEPPPEKSESWSPRELLVSGGLTFAALSSSAAYIAGTLASIDLMNLLVAVLSLIFMATVPTVLLLLFRLSRRDVGVVLQASDWAINHQLRLPRWAGRAFTHVPTAPEGAVVHRAELLRELLGRGPRQRRALLLALLAAALTVLWLWMGW